MITLITGTPGAGKTLFAVAEELPKYADRPLYVDGIPDLLVHHEPAQDPEKWHEWLPDNGVLVIDECQRIWRPRSSGAKVPPGVEALETHRHRGADIVLITQHPNLLDQNVRRLVGRHLHVRRVWGLKRSLVYEWDQATDPGRTSTAQKRVWAYPKRAFGQYKSATIHTARGQKPPLMLWIATVAIVALPTGGYYFYSHMKAKVAAPIAGVTQPPPGPGATHTEYPAEPIDPVIGFIPQYPDVPHSAPAYQGMVHVVSAPRIQGCVASRKKCVCYSQQSTPLEISEDLCRRHATGQEFDPYTPDQVHQETVLQNPDQIRNPAQPPLPPENPNLSI